MSEISDIPNENAITSLIAVATHLGLSKPIFTTSRVEVNLSLASFSYTAIGSSVREAELNCAKHIIQKIKGKMLEKEKDVTKVFLG